MNKLKKISSLLIALAMILALAVPAFAAQTGSITINNPVTGTTYKAYKVFDVAYDAQGKAFSYTISESSEWYNVVKGYNKITLTKDSSGKYIVETKDGFSAAEFSNVLKAAVNGKTGFELTLKNGKATVDGLELGYYFVDNSAGALCNLTTTSPDAVIYDKNDVPFSKTDDKESVEVGETVTYTIKGKVPSTVGFTKFTYTIKDTMSDGLTFNDDIQITVGEATLSADKYTIAKKNNGFEISFDVMKMQDNVSKEIQVKYTAKVNDKAVAVISKNEAKLIYSNNPTDESKTETNPVEETVFSAKIVIDKFEKGNKDHKLDNANFVLLNEAQNKYYKYTPASEGVAAKVEWVDNESDATEVTTDTFGAAEFLGLKNGTYYLKETASPEGYNMLTSTQGVVVNGTNTSVASLTVTSEVENGTGSVLPGTGGIGVYIFYITGGILVVGAAVMLIAKKRSATKR